MESKSLFLLSSYHDFLFQQNLVRLMGEEPIVLPNLSECQHFSSNEYFIDFLPIAKTSSLKLQCRDSVKATVAS